METGKRLAALMKQDWALPVSAMIGTFLLTLLVNGLGALVPCVGWIVPALVGMVGLGAVLVTRFGAQALPDAAAAAPSAQVVDTIPLPSAAAGEPPVRLALRCEPHLLRHRLLRAPGLRATRLKDIMINSACGRVKLAGAVFI